MKKLSFKGAAPVKKRKVKEVVINTDEVEEEGWCDATELEDLNGPAVLYIPQEQPVCLACDARGQLFPMAVESAIIEPNDVRQVFVLTRREKDMITLKSAEGKYVSITKIGAVKADTDAVSASELFKVVRHDARFALKTVDGRYISLSSEVRADEPEIGDTTSFSIRVQRKNKFKEPNTKKARLLQSSRSELERKVGRKLTEGEIDSLRSAEIAGHLHESVLDMRVGSKSDKFG